MQVVSSLNGNKYWACVIKHNGVMAVGSDGPGTEHSVSRGTGSNDRQESKLDRAAKSESNRETGTKGHLRPPDAFSGLHTSSKTHLRWRGGVGRGVAHHPLSKNPPRSRSSASDFGSSSPVSAPPRKISWQCIWNIREESCSLQLS